MELKTEKVVYLPTHGALVLPLNIVVTYLDLPIHMVVATLTKCTGLILV